MKKLRGNKKKNNNSKKKKSFFYNDKFAATFIIVTFLTLVILLGVVNKSTGNTITGQPTEGTGTQFIYDLFAQWEQGGLDVNIAKYLFFFMLTGLIWGALSFAKFPTKNVAFQALIAIPVGFLSTAYITPNEVFTILTSYTALGITLSFLVPFIILIFVSAMLVSNEKINNMSVPKVLLEVFLWIFFTVILAYKLISGMVTGQIELAPSLPMIIMAAVFLISVLFVIFNSSFRRYMWRVGMEIRKAQSEAAAIEAEKAIELAQRMERAKEKG